MMTYKQLIKNGWTVELNKFPGTAYSMNYCTKKLSSGGFIRVRVSGFPKCYVASITYRDKDWGVPSSTHTNINFINNNTVHPDCRKSYINLPNKIKAIIEADFEVNVKVQ